MKLEHEHSPAAIRHRLARGPRLSYLRDWIYGGIDGAVTTFAVVSGVSGAELAPAIIVILGVANLIADGFSMAASNFSGTRAERDEIEHLRGIEARHIAEVPEGEREEVRQIYAAQGLQGATLEGAVNAATDDPDRWIALMLKEEYGLPASIRSPIKAGLATFIAFQICGVIPLLPYLLDLRDPFLLAAIATAVVFFAIGCVRSRWATMAWWRAGLGTLAIGGSAAALAYWTGHLVSLWVGKGGL